MPRVIGSQLIWTPMEYLLEESSSSMPIWSLHASLRQTRVDCPFNLAPICLRNIRNSCYTTQRSMITIHTSTLLITDLPYCHPAKLQMTGALRGTLRRCQAFLETRVGRGREKKDKGHACDEDSGGTFLSRGIWHCSSSGNTLFMRGGSILSSLLLYTPLPVSSLLPLSSPGYRAQT